MWIRNGLLSSGEGDERPRTIIALSLFDIAILHYLREAYTYIRDYSRGVIGEKREESPASIRIIIYIMTNTIIILTTCLVFLLAMMRSASSSPSSSSSSSSSNNNNNRNREPKCISVDSYATYVCTDNPEASRRAAATGGASPPTDVNGGGGAGASGGGGRRTTTPRW